MMTTAPPNDSKPATTPSGFSLTRTTFAIDIERASPDHVTVTATQFDVPGSAGRTIARKTIRRQRLDAELKKLQSALLELVEAHGAFVWEVPVE
jgi:hypothetical protein